MRRMRSAARAPTSGQAWAVALCATLVMTVSYVDRQTMAAIAPTLTRALRIDEARYGLLTSAFSISYLLGAPIAGALIDRVGARRGLPLAVVAWSCVAALHALAPGFAVLFLLRVGLGAAEAPSFPGAAQAVRRVLPRRVRATGVGLLFTGSSVGAAMVAPIAVRLNARLGWAATFVGVALVGAAWVPAWLAITRSPRVRALLDHPRDDPPPGHATLPAGALPAAGALSGAGALSAAATLSAAEPAAAPAQERAFAVLRLPAVLRASLLVLCVAPAAMFLFNWMAKYLVALGEPLDALAVYLWAPPLALDLGAVGLGMVASRRDRAAPAGEVGERRDLVALAALCVLALAGGPWVTRPVAATLLCCVGALGAGGVYSLVTSDMLARVDVRRASVASGTTAAAQSLAFIVAAPLVGQVLARAHSYGLVLVALGLAVVPGALAWIVWPMRESA
jgi:ACS family hexuronate transporter-like MFS transporter